MKKLKTLLLLGTMAFLLVGCFALQEPEESTGAVAAPTIAAPTDSATDGSTPVAESTQTSDTTSTGTVYTIDATQSEARFIIEEVLRGADTTVVGVTSNVAGQVALDINNPTSTEIGSIVINARDIATDSEFRDRAIGNEILLTDEYELITFTPTNITGLPNSATIGESYTFQIVGDLTITDQTHEVTFEATVTPDSATQLTGLASAEILYADFNLTIPFSQSVDSVEDSVILELEFVALAN